MKMVQMLKITSSFELPVLTLPVPGFKPQQISKSFSIPRRAKNK
jgi:hypothetical protein